MTAHSKLFSASGASGWTLCSKKPHVELNMPDQSSVYALEGSCAHEVAALCLDNEDNAETYLGRVYFDTEVDMEMVHNVQDYVDDVRMRVKPGATLMAEQQVNYRHLEPEGHTFDLDEGFGTSDALIFDFDARELIVVDLKYGKGVKVDVEHNKQAMLYACGALNTFIDICEGAFDKVTLVIHQPRLNHVSEWSIPVEDLREFENDITEAMRRVLEEPEFVPGETQCRWCRGKAVCKAHFDWVMGTYESNALVGIMTNDEIGQALNMVDAITTWAKEVKDYAKRQIEDGVSVPGYKLVAGRSVRKWTDEEAVRHVLSKSLRVKKEQYLETKLISVAAAQKLLGKAKFEKLSGLVNKPEGPPTLAPVSDSRPAIDATHINFINFEEEKDS